MAALSPKDAGLENSIDVIVQYTKDGHIIPMRIRLEDEDGMIQTYSIRGFRELNLSGEYVSPAGIKVFNKNKNFEVKIAVFGVERVIRLFFDGQKWFLRGSRG